jgi:hypothetical protein
MHLIQLDTQLQECQLEIDSQWIPYNLKMIPPHSSDRLIVFRPQRSQRLLGCIRVYKAGTTIKEWDVYDTDGTFIGIIPEDCTCEAMLVEIKLITPKDVQS